MTTHNVLTQMPFSYLAREGFWQKMNEHSLSIYIEITKIIFSQIITRPKVSPEDKVKIKELLKKPWNPYIRRHTALTEKSQFLKEHTLRQHAGWSPSSNMHLKYIHYFGNESNESYSRSIWTKAKIEEIDKLKPKQCPNCSELNQIDSKFCVKCRMILCYNEYLGSIENQKQKENEIVEIKNEISLMKEGQKELLELLKNPTQLFEILHKESIGKWKIPLESRRDYIKLI